LGFQPKQSEAPPSAFEGLLQREASWVYSYLRRCGLSDCRCDAAFEEIFAHAHVAPRTALDATEEGPKSRWWFAQRVVATARQQLRDMRVRELVFGDDGMPAIGAGALDALETGDWIDRMIAQLPIASREVVALSWGSRLAPQAVAEVLGFSPNAVTAHLRRARLAIAYVLAERTTRLAAEGSEAGR